MSCIATKPSRAEPERALAPWAVGLLLVGTALHVAAETTPYYFGLSQSFAHDNNMLRLGNGESPPAGLSRADSYSNTSLLAGIDQGFGRQRATANLSLRDARYQANPVYNNQGYTGSAALDWSTVERISGSLSASANRSLSGFNTYEVGLLRQRNYEDTTGINAGVNVGLVTQYSLETLLSHREVRNTLQQQSLQSRNFTQDSGSAGLRWRPRAATSLGLTLRQTRGRYPKYRLLDDVYQANRYQQTTVEMSGTLQPSGASNIDLRIGQTRTRYDLNEARNFSGITGSLGWVWQPTGHLRTGLRLTRDTGQDSYAVTVFTNVPGSSDYSRIVNTLRLDAGYDYSGKIGFTGYWQLAQHRVVQTITNPVLPLNASGHDNTSTVGLGVRWAPLRTVSLGCDAAHEDRRGAGQLTITYSSFNFSCFGQLRFQP